MNIQYLFLSFADLKNRTYVILQDPDKILKSGLELYADVLLSNPLVKEDDKNHAVCLAIVDGQIAGRTMLFPTRLRVGGGTILIQTGGGLIVSKKFRCNGIGTTIINKVRVENPFDLYYGALFSRPAYDKIRRTNIMLEIPQYVKERYSGLKKILELPLLFRLRYLKKRFIVKKLSIVPEWAGQMATSDSHKYYEVHDTKWLQWALDNTATGIDTDYQTFYAIYNREDEPIGFFMSKIRSVVKNGESFVKANIVEWASANLSVLSEADINILSLETFDPIVKRVWTISESIETGKKLKWYSFKRRGWLAMSVKDKKGQFPDIGDVSQWRIRYGCCNTVLVE